MEKLIENRERLKGVPKVRRERRGPIVPDNFNFYTYTEELRIIAEQLVDEGVIKGPITISTLQDVKEWITIEGLRREGRIEEMKALLQVRHERKMKLMGRI